MFGYILPAEDKLSEEEKLRFRSVYCGLCHTLGKKYGLAARFLLNYDFTFLAILLSDGGETECRSCRCIAHPCRSRCVMQQTPALETAANRSVILSWWQLSDHITDSSFLKSLPYRVARIALRRAYKKAQREAPGFDQGVKAQLTVLAEREAAFCDSIDAAAEPFAALMGGIAQDIPEERKQRVLEQLFYHLGRWIYLVDAADDYEKDYKCGNYNPLRYRYCLQAEKLGEEEKKELAQTLDQSVVRMAGAYALCDYGVWTPILDSVFYQSLYSIGNAVLRGTYRARPRRIKQRKTEDAT